MKTFALIVILLFSPLLQAADPIRNLVTDEPRLQKGKPDAAPEYVAKIAPNDGQHLALTMRKLQNGIDPPRPFFIWAIGSSYTNMLGNGEFWQRAIPKSFPKISSVRYEKMVGNSCPWQYLQGWARHLVVPDQPDLVLIYTLGQPADLEKLIIELRTQTTADIVVPSIHWRQPDAPMWGNSENSPQQDVAAVRAVCAKYGVEFVENRRDWGEYLKTNSLPLESLLKDAVHQSEYGASIINSNILAHFRTSAPFSYDPAARERQIQPERAADGSLQANFIGNRIDLIGRKSPRGGIFRIVIDGKPAEQIPAFLMSYVKPDPKNHNKDADGKNSPPRDQSPHGITLGHNVVPQTWTIEIVNDRLDYILVGSHTGADGIGNAMQPFTSTSGQILIEPDLWRRAERNRRGDRFTFDVRRSVLDQVSFQGEDNERFTVRLAQALSNSVHSVKLVALEAGDASIEAFHVFQPPMP